MLPHVNYGEPTHAARDVSLALITDLFAEERPPQPRLGRDDLYMVLQDHPTTARRQVEHQRPALFFGDDGGTERNRRALRERVNGHPLHESQVGSELLDALSLPPSDVGLLERASVLVVLRFRFFVGRGLDGRSVGALGSLELFFDSTNELSLQRLLARQIHRRQSF